MTLENGLIVIEVAATIAFALSGLIESTRKRMDIIGVFSVTFVSAFGGGTLRDIVLDRRPLFWVQHSEYIWLILLLVLAAPALLHAMRNQWVDRVTELADAAGLGLFAISGASLSLVAGMPFIVCVLLGALTAVFGGVLRDVLCNEIPKVFHDHRPYTVCTFVGCSVFLGLQDVGLGAELSSLVGIATTSGLRLLAIARGWQIPAWPKDRQGR